MTVMLSSRTRLLLLASTLLPLPGAFAATATTDSPSAIPAEVYAPIAMEAGTWDAEITFFEKDKPSATGKGVQVNTLLLNGHWITNDFRIPATDRFPAYQGHGVWGYDPVAATYVDTWVDTNDLSVRTDYGYWQPNEQIMTWSSKQNDGKGHFVDYRIVEEFKGDTRILTFSQLGMATPNPHPLVKIVFTRRTAGQQAG